MRRRSSLRLLASGLATALAAAACASGGAPEIVTDERAQDTLPRDDAPARPSVSDAPRAVLAPRILDLGVVEPFTEVALEVPRDAVGLNVVVQSEAPLAKVGILRITSPTGERVHDGYVVKGGSHPTSLSVHGGIAAVAIPQGEAASFRPLVAGTWRVVFGDGRLLTDGDEPPPSTPSLDRAPAMRARAAVQVRPRGAETFAGARLDVVVHVPDRLRLGERTVDAASAASDPSMIERFHVFFQGFAELFGVDRGDLRFVAAPPSLRSLGATSLVDAFSASRGMPDEPALHVVLTNDVMLGMGGGAWGVAPGVPGAAVLNGTAMSCVVLMVGETPPDVDGLVLLHETGHFLGLSHTTELDGRNADPLGDTQRCAGLTFADAASAEGCPDRYNLMFPTFTHGWGEALTVSDAQRDVVRSSPVLRAYADVPSSAEVRPLELTSRRRAPAVPAGRPLCATSRAP